METPPRICVVIPVYNHGLTVQTVVRGAKAFLPVIAVNDGSTDATPALLAGVAQERAGGAGDPAFATEGSGAAAPAAAVSQPPRLQSGSAGEAPAGLSQAGALAPLRWQCPAAPPGEHRVTVVTLPRNQGKAAALQAGFAKAEELGFTHAITIDADGQHSTNALGEFASACQRQPEAFIIGVRDFDKAGAPFARRASNDLSTFWFKFETGVRLADTQCGYRCYPLAGIRPLHVKAGRYAYELEIMVKAAWAGIPLVAQPVEADYAAPTSRLSHFRPWRDMAGISWLHSKLSMQAFCVPVVLRKLSASGVLRHMPRGQRLRTVLRHLYSENTETPARVASAVGLGLFCGIAPIWGFQMAAAAALAHKFRLNKAIALTASNISFPLVAPFLMAAGLIIGHFLWTGRFVDFAPEVAARQIPAYLCQWAVGSVVLAVVVGALGMLVAFLLARLVTRAKPDAP